jgi:simple sugar transport system permease protein
MSDTIAPTTPAAAPEPAPSSLLDRLPGSRRTLFIAGLLFVLLAFVRTVTDATQLTSSSTVGVAIRATMPILLAGLAGLWAERAGIINIGIEGMMILGTWFGGWAAWQWGPWVGLIMAVIGGMIGGLVHAVAVVKFNIDHIISGVAINILAFGAMRFLSELTFLGHEGGGISQSPKQSSPIPRINLPLLAGGGDTPDALGNLEDREWFLISDIAGVLGGFARGLSWASVIALALVPISAFVLWRTVFGIRVRSSGEAPAAAETLGVKVIPLRYAALIISGGFAGLGGGYLAIVSSSFYREGQTASRGFIGLATMIFGNWRPTGVLGGASLFGFGEALNLVGPTALPKLFLFLTIVAGLACVRSISRQQPIGAAVQGALGVACLVIFITVDKIPEPLTKSVPFALTLVVLAAATQRLRPPAHDGKPYRSGEEH